jgi:hypothetical protein
MEKRERRESGGSSERRHILEGVRDRHFPTSQVPRHCPLVIPVQARLGEDKESGSEEGKALGSGLCYEQVREVEQGLNTVYDGTIFIVAGRATVK